MADVIEVSAEKLNERRRVVVRELGLTEGELRAHANDHSATPEEWEAWTELQTIRFLLEDDG